MKRGLGLSKGVATLEKKQGAEIKGLRSKSLAGFTIVETMIFLAVTSALLVSALTMISGSQNRAEFKQAINDLNQQIGQVMGNVANGYYANIGNFIGDRKCQLDGSNVVDFGAAGSGTGQGSNSDCVFIGRALQFVQGSPEVFVYSLAGTRAVVDTMGSTRDVDKFEDVKPRVIEGPPIMPANTDWPNATETIKLKNGISIEKVQYKHGGSLPGLPTGGVVFYSSLAGFIGGTQNNGAASVDFSPIKNSYLTDSQNTFIGKLENYSEGTGAYSGSGYDDLVNGDKNTPDGVWICMDSGGTNQHATITIGGSLNQSATKLEIKNGKCAADDIS